MNKKPSLLVSLGAFIVAVGASVGGCGSDEAAVRPELTDGGAGSGGSAGGGAGGSGQPSDGGAIAPSPVGQRCLQDSECAAGLVCITSDSDLFSGGGVEEGMCTVQCTTNGDCFDIHPNTYCAITDDGGTPRIDTDDIGYCFEGCEPFSGSEDMCHGRPEMICFPETTTFGICNPFCTSDYKCGGGRVCDLRAGLCVDPANVSGGTLPIGSECSTTDDQCAGRCAGGECTAFCNASNLVTWNGCGEDPTSTEPPNAVCIFVTDPATGPQDIGLCGQLCDCDDDCLHPDAICDPLSADLQAVTSRLGVCVPADPDGGVTEGIPCEPSGGDGGTSTPPEAGPPPQDAAAAADTGAPDAP